MQVESENSFTDARPPIPAKSSSDYDVCAPSAVISRPEFEHVDSLAAKELASRHAAQVDRQADLLLQIGRVDSRSNRRADSRERSGALVERRSVEKSPNADDLHGRGAKRAGLAGRVEITARQGEATQFSASVPDRLDLAVRGRIEAGRRMIESGAHNGSSLHDDCAERLRP